MSTADDQRQLVEEHKKQTIGAYERSLPRTGIIGVQKAQAIDRGASGPIWVSRTAIPSPPEPDLCRLLQDAMQDLGQGSEKITPATYSYRPLHAEWTAYRADVLNEKEPEPAIPEAEKYQRLIADNPDAPTVLYMQGGGQWSGSTITARPAVKRLARTSGARFLTINYRLAPRYTLPAPHLDTLVAYFSLLAPPPGLPHAAVPADRIIFAGESAGASLCLSVIQFLLYLRRRNVTHVTFHGQRVPVSLPAGCAILSLPGDFPTALPSAKTAHHDWLANDMSVWQRSSWPEEPYWPADPPRACIFVDVSALAHPLFSVSTACDWAGAPPIWFTEGGGERLLDSARIVACLAAKQGVKVWWEEYEHMTHSFATVIPKLPQTARCLSSWGRAIKRLGDGQSHSTGGVWVGLGDLPTRDLTEADILKLTDLTPQLASQIMEPRLEVLKGSVYRGGVKRSSSRSSL